FNNGLIPSVMTGAGVRLEAVEEVPAGPWLAGVIDEIDPRQLPNDRTWHNGHTRQQLSVTVDDSGAVKWTSVVRQSRTVTPYDDTPHLATPDGVAFLEEQPPSDEPPPF